MYREVGGDFISKMRREIWFGDCLELMSNIPDNSIDCVICDLPFGTISCAWDIIIPFDKLWEQYNRICKNNAAVVLFGSQPFTTDLILSNRKNFKYPLIWSKNVPTGMSYAKYRPMKYHEDILIFYREQPTYNPIMKERVGVGKACYNYDHYCGKSNHIKLDKVKKKYDPNYVQPSSVLDFKVVPNRNGKLHPTQKPVELLEYLIKTYTNEGDLILDNCAGSGSTLVAARNLNRQFIGIEKEKEYYDICVERLNI
jgi:site-specific DNA-methyltransferase (adenine-specific)